MDSYWLVSLYDLRLENKKPHCIHPKVRNGRRLVLYFYLYLISLSYSIDILILMGLRGA